MTECEERCVEAWDACVEAWQELTGNVLGVEHLVMPGAIGECHSHVSDEWDVH